MTKQNLDLNKPSYTLTIGEMYNLIDEVVNKKISETPKEKRKPIKGIHQLSKYLGISPATCQKLKNKGEFPYFQSGKTVLFEPDKIDEIIKKKGVCNE